MLRPWSRPAIRKGGGGLPSTIRHGGLKQAAFIFFKSVAAEQKYIEGFKSGQFLAQEFVSVTVGDFSKVGPNRKANR